MPQISYPADLQQAVSLAAQLREHGFTDHANRLLDTLLAPWQSSPAATDNTVADEDDEPAQTVEEPVTEPLPVQVPRFVNSFRDWELLGLERTSDADLERLIRAIFQRRRSLTSAEIRKEIDCAMAGNWHPGELAWIIPDVYSLFGPSHSKGTIWSYRTSKVLARLVKQGVLEKISRNYYKRVDQHLAA